MKRIITLDEGDKFTASRLFDRFQGLLQTRRLYEVVWQSIADLMIPRKNDIIVRKAPGVIRTQELFESTAIFAGELLAASLHGTLTSSYNPWFSLILDNPDLAENSDVKKWLEVCKEDLRLCFNRSNFAQESHEGYLDLVYFGTMCLLFEDRKDEGMPGEFRFTAVQSQNYAVAEDAMGRVNTVFRSIPLSKAAILERWYDVVKDMPNFNPSGKGRDLDTLCEVIHCIVPRDVKRPTLINPEYMGLYFLAKEKVKLGEAQPFHEFPALVPRWTKISGEVYGRGRGHTALPDVKSINKLVELELRALGKSIDPPMGAVGGDVIGHPKLQRGGVSTVRSKDSLFPLMQGLNYQPVNLKVEELREAIKKMFYADQLQMPTDNPQMTATEANIRYELMQRILGPTLGRLESEFLEPLIARAFAIRMRANKLPPIPEILLANKKSKPAINVGYQGPLARAQRASEVGSVQQLIQVAEPILAVKPDLLDNVDMDGLFAHTADILGVPAQYIKSKDDVAAEREQRQQAQEQAQQQQQQNERLTAIGKAGPALSALHQAPEEGSVMSQLTGQSGGNNQSGSAETQQPQQAGK